MATRVERLIGKSYENRNLYLYEFFVDKPKLNVLIYGAEHGIEKEAGDSCVMLMDDIEANSDFYDDINIVVFPYVNPDGIANGTYGNAQNYQIGYCPLNGVTPEFRAFWQYIRDTKFYPNLHINNHNLDHWSRGHGTYLYDHVPRLALHDDLVIGHTTINGLYRHKVTWNQWQNLVDYVSDNGQDHVYGKFWEPDDYGNTQYIAAYDVGYLDAFLGAFCDCTSFLIEGVVPADQTVTNPEWEPIKEAQFLANKYMIDWARKHPEIISHSRSVPPYLGEKVPVHITYEYDLFPHRHRVENDATGSVYNFYALSTEDPTYKQTKDIEWTTAPLAYAIHNNNEENLNIHMKWLGFNWTQGLAGDSYDVEQFHCTAADAWDDQDGDITYQWAQYNVDGYYISSTRTNFSQYTIYPVTENQPVGGLALINILEPIAYGNISRHQGLYPTLNLRANDDFPILRLIRKR